MKTHHYDIQVRWTGNQGAGTSSYTAYARNHEISAAGKQIVLPGSSDPAFRGDAARYNPEELLVASLSACHMLWVLHLCADRKIVVTSYEDRASGEMSMEKDGSGKFTRVTLHPKMQITSADQVSAALQAHHRAHQLCFIANSVNFDVTVDPEITSK
jgi:organic hydroperoxide reductase OsmC/OhrA